MKAKTLIILLDGVSSKDFFTLYDSGELPNIKSFFDGGFVTKNLVSTFPSESQTCYPLIFYGIKLSETEEIAQMWYDRKKQQFIYLWDFLPIFRLFMKKEKHTSVFKGYGKAITVGLKETKDAGAYIPPFYVISGLSLSKLGILVDTAVIKNAPYLFNHYDNIIFSIFSCDHLLHSYGFEGLLASLKNLDKNLGYIIGNKKLKDKLNIFIFSDHGNSPLKGKFEIQKVLKENRYHLTRYLNEKKDVALVSNLLNYAFLYTKDDPENILNIFNKYPQIGVVAYKNKKDNSIIISNTKGRAKIFKDNNKFCYFPEDGDPLGYKNLFVSKKNSSLTKESGSLKNKNLFKPEKNSNLPEGSYPLKNRNNFTNKNTNELRLTKDEWIEKTLDSRFPYAVVRLYEAFENKNCGDIAISFDNGYCPNFSFTFNGRLMFTSRWPTFLYNHGGLERDQILSFLIANGENIKSKKLKFAKLEDLYSIFKNYFEDIK